MALAIVATVVGAALPNIAVVTRIYGVRSAARESALLIALAIAGIGFVSSTAPRVQLTLGFLVILFGWLLLALVTSGVPEIDEVTPDGVYSELQNARMSQ